MLVQPSRCVIPPTLPPSSLPPPPSSLLFSVDSAFMDERHFVTFDTFSVT